tara:strand:- start:437 stop:631 length:195 start_codon:yes stop_codon:yes gene_type:complete
VLRQNSPVERVLTYATFLSLSLAVHMIVILGTRSEAQMPSEGVATTTSRTAALGQEPGPEGVLR